MRAPGAAQGAARPASERCPMTRRRSRHGTEAEHGAPAATPDARARPRRRWWFARWIAGPALVIIAVLGAARLALPWYLQRYVNRTIDQSPDYEGRVGDIDVHLYRGSYTIHDLKIQKRVHSVPVPFFESPRVDFSLDWDSLVHGVARGKI